MTKLLRISQVSLAALAIATVSAQAAITITLDDYRDNLPPSMSAQGDLVVNSLNTFATSGVQALTVPSISGAERVIDLTYVSGPSEGAASTLNTPGRLSFSGGPGGFGLDGTVATLEASYTLGMARDFTLGGGDSFSIDIHSRDPAVDAQILVSVASAAGSAMASAPFTLSGTVQAIPFTAFAGVDFTQVTGFSITINPEPAFDGSIRLIGVSDSSVPEPSGGVALLAILAGAVARRRRQ